MSLRQAFERLFPVPEGVVWEDGEYHPMQCGHEYTYSENCKRSNATNKGWGYFQAGHAAGLEDAAVECDKQGYAGTAAVIRAMKS